MVGSRIFAMLGAVALMVLGAVAAPQAASASTGDLSAEPRIAAMMAEVPGGVLLDENRAVWPDLGMRMEVPESWAPFAVGGCATGYSCAFDGYAAQGAKLSWSTCANPSTSSFTVRSIANARSSGYTQARAGTTVRATANAGGYANVYGSVDNLRCVS